MTPPDIWARAEAHAALAGVEGTVAEAEAEARGDEALLRYRSVVAECEAAGLTREALDAADECLRLRSAIRAGDGGAVLDAIGLCAAHSLVIPPWLADEYLRRHGAVGRGWAKDWNDARAFGLAYPKGTNIAGVRARVNDAPEAYRKAAELLASDPARAIDPGLYEDIGRHVGVGKTRAFELVAHWLIDCDGAAPPLPWLREHLAGGLDIAGATRKWQHERYIAEFGEPYTGK